MNITDVFTCAPGSRILVACALKAQESMIDTLCSSMPSTFKAKTSLNSTSIASMEVTPDDNPNRFSDLHGLCAKLINAAGRRSHFEGLLLLNVSALTSSPDNNMRLKALGEFLSMPEGLSSRCITLLYGPDKERDIISCADHLDFDGGLKVICYEQPNKLSLSELLTKSSLRCASPEIEHLLESTLTDMSGYEDFSASKFVRICGNERGIITAHEIDEMLRDPYSYISSDDNPGSISAELEALFDRLFASRNEVESSLVLSQENSTPEATDDHDVDPDRSDSVDPNLRSLLDDFLNEETNSE